jgi:hypothetical protein
MSFGVGWRSYGLWLPSAQATAGPSTARFAQDDRFYASSRGQILCKLRRADLCKTGGQILGWGGGTTGFGCRQHRQPQVLRLRASRCAQDDRFYASSGEQIYARQEGRFWGGAAELRALAAVSTGNRRSFDCALRAALRMTDFMQAQDDRFYASSVGQIYASSG